jgi:hypothetical protein
MFLDLVAEISLFNENRNTYKSMPPVQSVNDKAESQNNNSVSRY